MNLYSKKGIIVILIICIILAFGTLVYLRSNNKNSQNDSAPQETVNSAPTGETTKDNAPSENKEQVTPPKNSSAKPSYDSVLEQYKNSGYRIQISNCSGIPGKMNIKQGTKFMVDNRDKTKHTIKLASVSRVVEGYDYEIFVAPKYGSYFLTCDGKGSAELNVFP